MMYEIDKIEQLLASYWEGDTDLAEEATLRAYFASDQIISEHMPFAPLFQHFAERRSMTTDIDVEAVLSDLAPKKKSPFLKILSLRSFTMGIAAAMVVLLMVTSIVNINQQNTNQTIVLDEAAETEEAMRVTREALALLSSNLSKSSSTVNEGLSRVKSASILK